MFQNTWNIVNWKKTFKAVISDVEDKIWLQFKKLELLCSVILEHNESTIDEKDNIRSFEIKSKLYLKNENGIDKTELFHQFVMCKFLDFICNSKL